MDLWQQARNVWNGAKKPSNPGTRVDYDGLIAELKQVAYDRRRVVGEQTFVPCTYLVELSPQDAADLRQGGFDTLIEEALQKAMTGHIRERKYQARGAISVRFGESDRLGAGYVAVTVNYIDEAQGKNRDPERRHAVDHAVDIDPAINYGQALGGNQVPGKNLVPIDVDGQLTVGGHDLEGTVIRPPLGKAQASFIVEKGATAQLGKELVVTIVPAGIGRMTVNHTPDIGVIDPFNKVGRDHARIEAVDGVFRLQDMSKNGTSVNGKPLAPGEWAVLEDDFEVDLAGCVLLRFRTGERTIVHRRRKDWST